MGLVSFKVVKEGGWRSGDQCLFIGHMESRRVTSRESRIKGRLKN